MGVDVMCVSERMRVCLCVCAPEMHLAEREARLGELFLQLHVIFRIQALSLVQEDTAVFCFSFFYCVLFHALEA